MRHALCDLKDKVLGGGGGSKDSDRRDDRVDRSEALVSAPGDEGWIVEAVDNGTPSTISAQAICADFPPLRP